MEQFENDDKRKSDGNNLDFPYNNNNNDNKEDNNNDDAKSENMSRRMSQYSQGQVETHVKMIEVMSERANDKLYLSVDSDLLAYTVLALFKANRRKFQLTCEK